ncbi:hypothetical protein ADJ70_08160 [Olsenella sp. oral taxon 807]|jgi:band 7 protein|uniref:SPFH domain-containing protein n=1 Tax=Olsenella sp. oral taxon 807 TaxID=712411 RepID=UPI00067A1D6B|nr:SPFH domain-containing protein [Olsenella sp. oral taxon 807]AKT48920.1 hypothetical protein ADJ70_08160 [Olsenella sp. oral taxon 807]
MSTQTSCTEKKAHAKSGWMMIIVDVLLYAVSIELMVSSTISLSNEAEVGLFAVSLLTLFGSVLLLVVAIIVSNGFFTLQPGQARVCVLFGKYVGTVRDDGLHWANPFYARSLGRTSAPDDPAGALLTKSALTGLPTASGRSHVSKISLRARTHEGERIKVNDKMGNPIEIATVVVWRVADTAKAIFDVDDYEGYVSMQVETALRHVASIYAYDHLEDDDDSSTTITLRSNIEEVSEALKLELTRKLSVAGVAIEDARLTHLAYAPEIAQVMLRRQQADAVIAARKKIVEGAVSMVDMALSQLSDDGIVEFDEDRKAVMASNLMVVLCGESEAQPVLNTSSLYQ